MIIARIYFGVGMSDDARKNELRLNAIQDIERTLLSTFGGFTRYEGTGAWLSPERKEYRENSLVYELITTSDKRRSVRNVARNGKLWLGEEAAYVTFQDVEGELV